MSSVNALQGQAPGFTGKLAAVGDFTHRRLPVAVINRLDEWLSLGLAHGRARLGADWLPRYLHAPVWAFAVAPQVLDGQAWAGVLMPSVDAVGRYFPLVLAQAQGLSATPQAQEGTASQPYPGLAWFHALAQCALATLEPGHSLQGFETSLSQIQTHLQANDDDACPSPHSHHMTQWPAPAPACSQWWPLDLHTSSSKLPWPPANAFTCPDLPRPEQLSAMLEFCS